MTLMLFIKYDINLNIFFFDIAKNDVSNLLALAPIQILVPVNKITNQMLRDNAFA